MPETAGPADYFFWSWWSPDRGGPLAASIEYEFPAEDYLQILPNNALFSSPLPAAAAGQYLVIIPSFLNVFSRVLFAGQGDDF